MQVEELCEAANKEVGADEGVRIANFLCNGNYAVSGGLPGCEVGSLKSATSTWNSCKKESTGSEGGDGEVQFLTEYVC